MNQEDSMEKKEKKKSNKIGMIIVGLVILIIILIGVIIHMSVKINSLKQKIPISSMTDQEYNKMQKEVSEQYTIKDYMMQDKSILIEVNNKSNYGANADIKVELLDKEKKIIDVIDAYIGGIKPKGTGYTLATMWEGNYSSYRVTTKMTPAALTFHTDEIDILSTNEQEDSYIVEYKNKANEKIDSLEIGVLFYSKKNHIIGYASNIESDIEEEVTSSMKIRMPTNEEYNNIKYAKATPVVISAYTNQIS